MSKGLRKCLHALVRGLFLSVGEAKRGSARRRQGLKYASPLSAPLPQQTQAHKNSHGRPPHRHDAAHSQSSLLASPPLLPLPPPAHAHTRTTYRHTLDNRALNPPSIAQTPFHISNICAFYPSFLPTLSYFLSPFSPHSSSHFHAFTSLTFAHTRPPAPPPLAYFTLLFLAVLTRAGLKTFPLNV